MAGTVKTKKKAERNLEIVNTRSLFLKEGVFSDEIMLADADGDGNMYFRFRLKYISGDASGETSFDIKDAFHADVTIETAPNAATKLPRPYYLGTYGKDKDLLLNFYVQPRGAEGLHSVTVTFYTLNR